MVAVCPQSYGKAQSRDPEPHLHVAWDSQAVDCPKCGFPGDGDEFPID